MAIKIAINGFGRIGRLVFRQALKDRRVKVVAINDLTDAKTLAHLLKYDSVYGRFPGKVEVHKGDLVVNGKKILVFGEKDPSQLPWKLLKVDIVCECTGRFLTKELASLHLKAGARKVLLSAPAKDEIDFTIIYGVNHKELDREKHIIVSNGSCTTNCLAPVVDVLCRNFGVEKALMTTIHSYTNTQRLLDSPHKDLRRARGAGVNMIPTTTGAARTVSKVIPELGGRIDAMSVRVPTPCGSMIDLTCELGKSVTKEELDNVFIDAAKKELKGVLEYTEDPIVSTDVIGNPSSAIYDSKATMVLKDGFVKVIAWYDNEFGFSCRMIDVVKLMR